MRKRASIIRTLSYDADMILMDEPFSQLDAQTRVILQNDLLSLWETSRPAVLFVTHDLVEAIALSDQPIVIMSASPGHIKGAYRVDIPVRATFITSTRRPVSTILRSALGRYSRRDRASSCCERGSCPMDPARPRFRRCAARPTALACGRRKSNKCSCCCQATHRARGALGPIRIASRRNRALATGVWSVDQSLFCQQTERNRRCLRTLDRNRSCFANLWLTVQEALYGYLIGASLGVVAAGCWVRARDCSQSSSRFCW